MAVSFTVAESFAVENSGIDNSQSTEGTQVTEEMLPSDVSQEPVVEEDSITLHAQAKSISSVLLTWTTEASAEMYQIFDVTNGKKQIAEITDSSYTVTGLKHYTTYQYQVKAIGAAGEKSIESEIVSVTTLPITSLGQVKNLKVYPGYVSVTLMWSAVSNANYYNIYRYSSKKWKKIGTSTSTKYRVKGMKTLENGTFRVEAVCTNNGGKVVTGKVSASAKGEPVKSLYIKAKTKSKSPIYKTTKNKSKCGTLKKGAIITGLQYSGGKVMFRDSKGRDRWITHKRLNVQKTYYTKSDYAKVTKENYVNERGCKSNTKYLVWISQYTQRVNVFKGSKGKWKLYKTMHCATGVIDSRYSPTPRGTFKVYKKANSVKRNTWYCNTWTYFNGGTAMHTRTKKYGGGYKNATMGKPVSNGCVRMYDNDAKWIYKNIPKGTTVVSY